MLISAERFDNAPVMSLQTGSELARVARAVVDPRNLVVVAYELEGALLDQSPTLLRIPDIREIGPLGIIVDSVDELISPSDVIKIKEVYEFRFELIGKRVLDEKGRKVGRVIGYTLEAGNFVIQQLRVRRPLLQSFGDMELLIHRSQIDKVADDAIVVRLPKVRQTKPVVQPQTSFENPFRKSPQPATERAEE